MSSAAEALIRAAEAASRAAAMATQEAQHWHAVAEAMQRPPPPPPPSAPGGPSALVVPKRMVQAPPLPLQHTARPSARGSLTDAVAASVMAAHGSEPFPPLPPPLEAIAPRPQSGHARPSEGAEQRGRSPAKRPRNDAAVRQPAIVVPLRSDRVVPRPSSRSGARGSSDPAPVPSSSRALPAAKQPRPQLSRWAHAGAAAAGPPQVHGHRSAGRNHQAGHLLHLSCLPLSLSAKAGAFLPCLVSRVLVAFVSDSKAHDILAQRHGHTETVVAPRHPLHQWQVPLSHWRGLQSWAAHRLCQPV